MRTQTTTSRLHTLTPILDMDLDDSYLAELASRAAIAPYDESHRDAVLDWIN